MAATAAALAVGIVVGAGEHQLTAVGGDPGMQLFNGFLHDGKDTGIECIHLAVEFEQQNIITEVEQHVATVIPDDGIVFVDRKRF